MSDEIIMKLVLKAKNTASNNFCCKHSNFTVGACLVTKDGKVYSGFNIENDGIQSICAERTAFSKALTELNKEFRAIVIVGKNLSAKKFIKTVPCGYCRQFMNEYVDKDFEIITYDEKEDKIYKYTLEQLLPESFINHKNA